MLSPAERPAASQARSHGWLAHAPSTPLLTPRRLRAPDSPYAPARTSRPGAVVPSYMLPAAHERAEPPPPAPASHPTSRAGAEAPLPLPSPPARSFSSPLSDISATSPPILSGALLPVAEAAGPLREGSQLQARNSTRLELLATSLYYSLPLTAGHLLPPPAPRQARSGTGFKRRASANDLASISVGGGGGVFGPAGCGLRRNQVRPQTGLPRAYRFDHPPLATHH